MRKNHTFLLATFLVLVVFFFLLCCDSTYILVTFFSSQTQGVSFTFDSIARLVYPLLMFWPLLFTGLSLLTAFIFLLLSHINKGAIVGVFLFILVSFALIVPTAGLIWGAIAINSIYSTIKLVLDAGYVYAPYIIYRAVGMLVRLFALSLPCIAFITLVAAFVFGNSRMPDKYYK